MCLAWLCSGEVHSSARMPDFVPSFQRGPGVTIPRVLVVTAQSLMTPGSCTTVRNSEKITNGLSRAHTAPIGPSLRF